MASSGEHAGKTLKRADPSTIQDKFLVGYQGWFTCPGDGKPLDPHHHGWLHWFTYPIPDGGRPNTDLWPDTSEYAPSELFPAPGLKYANGEQAYLFSSRNARTVERHFHWMARHGVDGAFLQRFLGQCDLEQGNQAIRDQRDEVGELVRRAAEKEGRVYAIMYDISGVAPDRIQRVIEQDWIHLLREQRALDSPNYLKEKGKPVVTLWGFGMSDNNHDPAMVRAVTDFLRNNTPGGVYIMGGGPAHWRTSTSDADRNPEFVNVWLECFDAISPWTVGRYGDPDGADWFAEHNIKGDVELINKRNEEFEQGVPNRRHIDYIPVILPGGSGFNLSEGKWSWNGIKRLGGRFLWRQMWNVKRLGVRTVYGAMWDEYDEGTAFMPVVSKKRQLPVHDKYNFMALDEDGFDLPPDWYMRIAGFIAEGLRGERMVLETFPSKELDDYWATRPRYEEKADPSGSGEKNQTWEEWQKLAGEKGGADEPPPPPYTLEAEEPAAAPQQAVAGPSTSGPPPIAPRPTEPGQSMSPPPMGPRPEAAAAAGAAAVGVVGALNASPHRSPDRPPVPLASRPSMSRPSGAGPSGGAPPPVPATSRPQPPPLAPRPSLDVGGLANDFKRASISSPTAARMDAPPQHPARPPSHPSSRPTSPPGRPGSCANAPFPGYTPSTMDLPQTQPLHPQPPHIQTSHTPPGDPARQDSGSSTKFPEPSAPSPSPGPWSQASWPPPEWGASAAPHPPTSPTLNVPYTPYQSHRPRPHSPQPPHAHGQHPPHAPHQPHSNYGPPYPTTSTPPLPPRPSSAFGAPGAEPGFGFPQAQTGFPQAQAGYPGGSYGGDAYGPPQPQPYGAPAPYGGQQQQPYGYAPYGQQQGYGGYPPSTYAPPTSPPTTNFPPPPQRPGGWSSYPGQQPQQQGPRPPGSPAGGLTGMLPGGRIGSLAQTGLATGEKLFSKFTKRS